MKKKLPYLAAAVIATVSLGVLYVAVQQALRLGADEPQASMASDTATSLENGARPQDLTKGQVNMSTNMAPFIIIYDKSGKVISGNGYLDGQVPQVPIGVLRAAGRGKANRVTWQPEHKVRIASISYATRDYYVLAGRSLKVVEGHISSFGKWVAAVWATIVLLILAAYTVASRKEKRANAKEA
jgi:hypothetical protein